MRDLCQHEENNRDQLGDSKTKEALIMASVHRQKNKRHWFVAFAIWSRDTQKWQRCFWSTQTVNKRQAQRICAAWNKAAQKAHAAPRRGMTPPPRPRKGALSREAEQRVIADGIYEIRLAAGLELA
jgi:hypothetical protein